MLVVTALLLVTPYSAIAQTAATIVGDVTDPSGAAVPGVSVTITNEGTGAERTVSTNAAGQYRVTPLNPGSYTVRATADGFTTQVRPGIVLQVASVLDVSFQLVLGQVSETVEVTGAPPVLQTEEASVGNVVTSQELQRMPVNQRNYTRLILLMPGTSSITRSQSRGTSQSGTALYSVNGGRPQDNNYTLDGFDSNMQMMNSPGISPPMDAMQEFKVATNTGSDFGRSMGANVSMVIKSGTSELHGTLYEYLRNSAFDANEFFANRNGLGRTPFRLNQYGVAIGGPLPVMKNKMFWFASWEGFRRRRGSTQIGNVPTQEFRNGDFSALLSRANPVTIRDPFANNSPFANNVIPQSRINPAIPTALELTTPLPNRAGLVQNYIGSRSQANNRDGVHWRYDYNINEKNTFFFRFSWQNADLLSPDFRPDFIGRSEFDIVNYGGTWTHIFGPTTTLEVAFGTNQPIDPGFTDKGSLTRADFLSRTGLRMYQTEVFGDPLVNISFGDYGTPGAGGGVTGDNIWQTRSNLNLMKGKHSLKIGGQYQYRNFFTNTSNPMNGDASQRPNHRVPDGRRLAGLPHRDSPRPGQHAHRRHQPLHDGPRPGRLAGETEAEHQHGIDVPVRQPAIRHQRSARQPVGAARSLQREYFGTLMWSTTNPEPAPPDGRIPSTQPFQRGLEANRAGFGRALVQSDKNDFAPRFGIAYKVTDKTVIRTGFGIFYNSTFVQELQDLRKFWPFTVQQVFSPNRGGLPDFPVTDAGPSFESTAAIGGWPQNPENRSPFASQWNFFIQRQLQDDLTLDIGYVGSASRKQIGYAPLNTALTPGPGPIQSRRLLPNFGDLDGGSNQFSGQYNSMQVTLAKRYSSGLQFNLNYTWQKSLDNQSSLAENQKTQNPYDRRSDWSRSSWDINHVVVFSYVYELPFGRGRQMGSGWSKGLDLLAGGWSLEGITRLDSGPPFMVFTNQDIANTGRKTQRVNAVSNPNNGPKTADEWFNTSAFVNPAPFTFGNASPYITNADNIVSFDVALQKKFAVNERHAIELRGEFFNIGNTVSFSDPQGNFNNNAFGRVSGQRVDPRQIQFGLRWRF